MSAGTYVLLIAELVRPMMFMLLTDILTIRVTMVLTQIEAVNTTDCVVHKRIGESLG